MFFGSKKNSASGAVTTGMVAGVQMAPASHELASGASAPEAKPPVNVDELRRMLKQSMDVVLLARAEFVRVMAGHQEAVKVVKIVRQVDLPASIDDADVLSFIERCRKLNSEKAQAERLYRQSVLAMRDVQQTALRARDALLAACRHVAEQLPEDTALADDVFVAARALSAVDDLSSPDYAGIVRENHYTAEAVVGFEVNWVHLRSLLARTVTAAVEGKGLLARHTLAVKAMEAVTYPAVVLPKRPSPEEKQRFLRQIDSFMSKRRKAHADFVCLNESANAHVAQLYSVVDLAQTQIRCWAPACLSTQTDPELETAYLLLKMVQEKTVAIQHDLVGRTRVSPVDSVHRTEATAQEQVAIKKLREQMRLAADVVAHFNDSTNALRNSPCHEYNHKKVSYSDVSETGSWAALCKWWRDKQQEQRRANRDNRIMDAKRGLLQEAADHYRRRVKLQATDMRLAVLRNLPGKGKPLPCDELRILLNSVAWTQGEINSELLSIYTRYKSGCYPLY